MGVNDDIYDALYSCQTMGDVFVLLVENNGGDNGNNIESRV